MRLDTSGMNRYLYADQPKLNFWQKLGRTAGKIGSAVMKFAAPIVALAVPGFGIPLAAGLYGAGNMIGGATNYALSKDAAQMQQYNASVSGKQVTLSGLFEQAAQADIDMDFIIPSELNAPTAHTLMTREIAGSDMIQNFQM